MRHSFSLVLWSLIALLFVQCAKRGNPTGGPEDETPPVLLRAVPELNAIKFREDRIRLYFDEYVKLNKLKEQLIISPPIDPASYVISPQGTAAKYVQIELMDSLRSNTTYNFNFGQSIVDTMKEIHIRISVMSSPLGIMLIPFRFVARLEMPMGEKPKTLSL